MKKLSERKGDRLLNIKTRGNKSATEKEHYRYEPTPYNDLKLLFNMINLKETDHFVDFGSGKGRICFYTNYLFNCNVVGIEADVVTYHDSLLNLTNFNELHNKDNKVSFHNGYAQEYTISKEQNIFFFFNPFTITIFKQVIKNIENSLKKHPRKVTIILTYPIVEYVSFIIEETNFQVIDYLEAQTKKEKMNKFLILSN